MRTGTARGRRVGVTAVLIFGIALALAPAAQARSSRQPAPQGYNVSYPQCGKSLPTSPSFGIVGVNNGLLYSTNPCLGTELAWAQGAANRAPAFYANTADPGPAYSSHWPSGQSSPEV